MTTPEVTASPAAAIHGPAHVQRYLEASLAAKQALLESPAHAAAIARIGEMVAAALRAGRKVLVCGNGGSAADAQHIAAELVVRLRKAPARPAFAGIALTVDTSVLTACGNDFGFEDVFARQVEALGQAGDVLIGISTSGNSPNVIRAFEMGRKKGLACVLFGGGAGGKLKVLADAAFIAPSEETSHIQECHLAAYHAFLFLVEDLMTGGAGA